MLSARIAWALCLIGSVLLFLFSQSYVALVVLVLVVVLPLVLIVINQIFAHDLTFSLAAPLLAEKDEELSCRLEASNRRVLALMPIVCRINCRNVFTGEALSSRVMFPVGAKKDFTVPFAVASSHCGGVQLELEQVRIYDTFGLFATAPAAQARATATVLPRTFIPQLTVVPNPSKDIEADEYSQTKPGLDPSETFAIRDYRAGDSLKQIHWKLTSKYDRLIIKEAGLPVRHSFLVLLETSLLEGATTDPEATDAIGEIVVSLCQTLAEEQISFDVAWFDHEQGSFFKHQINTTDDLTGIIDRLLRAYEAPSSLDAFMGYAEAYGPSDYEHLLYISRVLPHDISSFAGEGRATAIICTRDTQNAASISDGMVSMYFCSPENYESELYDLAI